MPRRILLVKDFARFARRNGIEGAALLDLVRRADIGIIDADLGGGIVKLRLARPNEGRSGGFRTIVAYRKEGNVFFLFGFAKNERENIEPDELRFFRGFGEDLQGASRTSIEGALRRGELTEIEEEP